MKTPTNIALISLIALATTSAPALASQATPQPKPRLSSFDRATMHLSASVIRAINWQSKLGEVVTGIQEAAKHDSDFYQVTTDPATKTILVYRKGGNAAAIYNSIKLPVGTRIEYRSAETTLVQANKLMDSIWSKRPSLAAQGVRVTAVMIPAGGAVTVYVQHLTNSAKMAVLKASGGPKSGPVMVKQRDYVRVAATRYGDVHPFIAGELINPENGYFWNSNTNSFQWTTIRCTSGFTGLSTNGSRYIMTAYHCLPNATARFWTTNAGITSFGNPGPGEFMGSVTNTDMGHDIAFIKTTSSTVPYAYNGSVTSTSNVKVTSVQAPYLTEYVCTSGAYTGEHCGLYVSARGHVTLTTDAQGMGGTNRQYDTYMYQADSTDSYGAAAEGDSGGPVLLDSGTGSVTAVGGISAGAGTASTSACLGLSPTTCYPSVLFSDIAAEASNYSLNLKQ
jgi:Trypsin